MIWLVLTGFLCFLAGLLAGGWARRHHDLTIIEQCETLANEEISRLHRLLETAGIHLNEQGQKMIDEDWLDTTGSWTGERTADDVRPPAGQVKSWMEPRHKT